MSHINSKNANALRGRGMKNSLVVPDVDPRTRCQQDLDDLPLPGPDRRVQGRVTALRNQLQLASLYRLLNMKFSNTEQRNSQTLIPSRMTKSEQSLYQS